MGASKDLKAGKAARAIGGCLGEHRLNPVLEPSAARSIGGRSALGVDLDAALDDAAYSGHLMDMSESATSRRKSDAIAPSEVLAFGQGPGGGELDARPQALLTSTAAHDPVVKSKRQTIAPLFSPPLRTTSASPCQELPFPRRCSPMDTAPCTTKIMRAADGRRAAAPLERTSSVQSEMGKHDGLNIDWPGY